MEEEIWRDIPRYEGLYQTSNMGRVRSVDKFITYAKRNTLNDKIIRIESGKILSPSLNRYGYWSIGISKNNKRSYFTVHTLVLLSFRGTKPKGFEAAHLNGIRTDNRLENLKWASKKENMSHKNIHGTSYRGSKHHNAYLSEQMIKQIRSEYQFSKIGFGQRALAKKYGIPEPTVRSIVLRHTWKHI